jgi:hypothetical protein
MSALRKILLIAAFVVVVLAAAVAADRAGDLKQACDMCGNINQSPGKKKGGFICPKSSVKDCNININGWCCNDKRVNSKCKACWDLGGDDEDDEDDM